MTKSKELYEAAKEAGHIKEFLKFKGTGVHELKFVSDKLYNGKNFKTGKPEVKVKYTFEEDGEEKTYETAAFKKDEQGNETKEPSSFVQQMSDYSYGDEVFAEYKPIPGTPKGFIEVNPKGESKRSNEDIPVIEDEDDNELPEDF